MFARRERIMQEKIRLLIVDDEVQFLQSITRRLEMRDFEVTQASNGEDALQAARSHTFELAILDLKMPGMNGDEILQILKNEDPYIEVLILTGHGSIESAVECTKLGAYGYLPKPYELDDLIEVLQQAYESRMLKKSAKDNERLEAIHQISLGNSPLGILRKLRELDRE